MLLSLLFIIPCVFALTVQQNNILDYECETNFNCTNILTNSICFNKKCIEKNQLRYRRQINYGMKMLGEDCDWANQCRQTPVDGTKVCLAHKCQCSQGYVPIDAYRCVRDFEPVLSDIHIIHPYDNEPPGYGSTCLTNNDCQQTTIHLECLRGICVCLEGYLPLGKYLCYNIRGQGSSSNQESLTITSTPISTTTIINRQIENQVIKSLGKIGNTCTNDYFCRRAVFQSHCYNGKCTCMDGYISIDQYTCMKNKKEETTIKTTLIPVDYKSLLGGNCVTRRNCHTSNAICRNSICTCPEGYFPVDDWTCLLEPDSSNEELIETTSIIPKITTALLSTTTVFRWWPWSPTPTTRQPFVNLKNAFRARCLLNRQCASMDKNSHCTLFGRCVCNPGYQLKTTNRGQRCISRMIDEDDCD